MDRRTEFTIHIAAWSQLKIILIIISPKFIPTGEIDNTSALIQVMPWHQNRWQCSTWNNDNPGLLTHIHAYVGLWTMSLLIQIMACHLLSPKPSLAPKLNYCSLDPGSKLQWNLNLNKLIFFYKNGFENIICKISTILLSSSIDTSKTWMPCHSQHTWKAPSRQWINIGQINTLFW